jgi:hypothetical protein
LNLKVNDGKKKNDDSKFNDNLDYIFAKTEMEDKQNRLIEEKYKDELNKHKEEMDRIEKIRIKELERKYEKDMEKMVRI